MNRRSFLTALTLGSVTLVSLPPIGETLGRPVLTGNQVAFWYALQQAGVREPVNGYGRVFKTLNSEGR